MEFVEKRYALRWKAHDPETCKWPVHGAWFYNGAGLGLYENPKRAHMMARNKRRDKLGYWEIVEIDLVPVGVIKYESGRDQ